MTERLIHAEPRADLLSVVAARLDGLHTDVREMRDAQTQMASAIAKLAVIEERQAASVAANDRAFESIGSVKKEHKELDQRVRTLEMNSVSSNKWARWLDAGMVGLVVLVVQVAFKKLF